MYTPGYLVKQTLARNGRDQRTLAIVCGWSESKVSRLLTDQDLMTAAESLVLAELLPELSAERILSAQSHLELARARLRYRPKPLAIPRTDSDRYDELRALVEAWQSHQAGSSTALAEWRHQ